MTTLTRYGKLSLDEQGELVCKGMENPLEKNLTLKDLEQALNKLKLRN